MKVLRRLLAVLTGYLVFAVSAVLLFQLSGVDPHADQSVAFMAATAIYGMFFASVGGMITARLAPDRPPLHAALLAVLIATGAVGSMIASPGGDATWSQWESILLMAPSAFLVPWISRRRQR